LLRIININSLIACFVQGSEELAILVEFQNNIFSLIDSSLTQIGKIEKVADEVALQVT